MPIVPSRAGRIRALVEQLASERPAERDSAVARLTLIGPRVLEPLRAALVDASPETRLAALEVLERLDEPRALPVLLPLTEDSNRAVAVRAIELTGRRPDSRSVAALTRALGPGPGPRRRAAVHALAELHAAGAVEALSPLVDTLVDEETERRLRIAILDTLLELEPPLPLSTLRPLVRRLASSTDSAVAARAAELAPAPGARESARRTRGDTVRRLRGGEPVEGASLEERHAALESAENPPAIERLARALGTAGGPASIPVLSRALGRLAEAPEPADDPGARVAARASIHTALAALDSRVALHDLRELVAARPRAVMPALLDAAARVGDASLVPALAQAATEDPALMPRCTAAYVSIARRERLRKTSPSLRKVRGEHRPALEAFLEAANRRRR
jgi:HEAT repeat protein